MEQLAEKQASVSRCPAADVRRRDARRHIAAVAQRRVDKISPRTRSMVPTATVDTEQDQAAAAPSSDGGVMSLIVAPALHHLPRGDG